MQAVTGLLLMLLGVSHGVETYCDGRQDGTQCYGALGGTVVLRLMNSASEIFKYQWTKNRTQILEGRENTIQTNMIEDRSSFTPSDGTFRINKLSRTDGGEYNLTTFDSGGKKSEPLTLQLNIQAPVSSVLLVHECLSQGEMKVSCSYERGDSPQYSWTLDGQTLADAELLSGTNESNNITLKQNVSGQLVCSVRNHISTVSKEEKISPCKFINCTLANGTYISEWVLETSNIQCFEPTTTSTTTEGKETDTTVSIKPSTNNTSSNQNGTSIGDNWFFSNWQIMAGILSALVLLLLVGVAVVCTHKRKQNKETKGEEDEQELTYADVRVVQRQARQVQPKAEVEVEYGQVKFSERPRQTVQPAADDVYARVRKDR